MTTNQYGLDVSYFQNCIDRDLGRGLMQYKPDEFARVCLRMAVTADEKVLSEPEFAKYTGMKELIEHNRTLRKGIQSLRDQLDDYWWEGVK